MAENVKTFMSTTRANTKTCLHPIANCKTIMGVDNTGGGGGIALLASLSASSPDGLGFTSGPMNTTGASLLVVIISDYASATATTLSDSEGNTWTVLTESASAGARCRIAYTVPSSTNASHTFTLTGAGTYGSICVAAFSGTHASPFDQQNGATGNAASLQTGSITPSENGELLIAGLASEVPGDVSINSSFTDEEEVTYGPGAHFASALAYYVQPTAGAINPTWSWTGSVTCAARIASFKAA